MAVNHTSVMSRPMSVSQIVERASDDFYDDWYPPKNWFRTADLMFKQGNIYMREGNFQPAYFLLYRHAILVLNKLEKHPQIKDPQYRQSWTMAQHDATISLTKLEDLRPRINKHYEKYLLKRKEARERIRREDEELHFDTSADEGFDAKSLNPAKDAAIGVELANEHTFARASRRRQSLTKRAEQPEEEDLGSLMRDARRRHDQNLARFPEANYVAAGSPRLEEALSYPSRHHEPLSHSSNVNRSKPDSALRSTSNSKIDSASLPPRPPKQLDTATSAPPVPGKFPALPPKAPPVPPKIHHAPFSRPSTSQNSLEQFELVSSLESGAPLRTIFLPSQLRDRFLELASSNTSRNLETLGLLCGNLLKNALFITALLIPPQTATSDTCEMTDAGEILVDEFVSAHSAPDPMPDESRDQDNHVVRTPEETGNDMMILGWIHTHPTQTCFLSSRDLHTHVWYQAGLPEAIAVVCSPSKGSGLGHEWDAFRLTDPPGMGTVKTCKQSGVFHPHADVGNSLFQSAVGRPGHVVEVKGLEFEVVDRR